MADDGVVRGDDGVNRCWWGDSAPEYRAYHDDRVGLPGRRRRAAVREAQPRGLPGRPLVADDPAQAGGVPARVRRLRLRAGRAVRRAGRRAAARRCSRSCATAARSRRSSTTRVAPSSWSEAEGSLAAYVWRFEPAPRADAARPRRAGRSSAHTTQSRALARTCKPARLAVRRPDDRVRVHAGDGAGQRPPRRLRRPRAG